MKIYIREIPNTLLNEIFFVNRPNDLKKGDVIQFINFKENGEAVQIEKVHEYGMAMDDIKPTMILPENQTRELLSAFSELAKSNGFEHDSESKAKGKLEATERHLSDLRQLLKLK